MPELEFGDLDVSRETIERLQHFANLVKKWTKSINLIAPSTVNDIWSRHIIDSAQVYAIAPDGWTSWTDIGSGGGFPGIVAAILDDRARLFTLIEADQRKSLFLKTVKRELGLNVEVEQTRIEHSNAAPTDILSARALASLPDLLRNFQHLLKPDGTAIFPKGQKFQEELDQARIHWHFDAVAHPSRTHQDGRILEISGIKRREP